MENSRSTAAISPVFPVRSAERVVKTQRGRQGDSPPVLFVLSRLFVWVFGFSSPSTLRSPLATGDVSPEPVTVCRLGERRPPTAWIFHSQTQDQGHIGEGFFFPEPDNGSLQCFANLGILKAEKQEVETKCLGLRLGSEVSRVVNIYPIEICRNVHLSEGLCSFCASIFLRKPRKDNEAHSIARQINQRRRRWI